MLSVGLLFVTLVGFLSGGVLVDQIETFFTENRREEPETGQKFHRKQKTRTGNGRKKDFLTIAFSSFMIYNRRWGETVGKRKTKKKEHILVCLSSSPSNEKIIRTAAQMHQAFSMAGFTALYVNRNSRKTEKQPGGSWTRLQ